jgi:hypothetical protein
MAAKRNPFAVIVGCVTLAIGLWGYVTLSRSFEVTVMVPLVVAAPTNQAVLSDVPTHIHTRVRATGLQLVNMMFITRVPTCSLDLDLFSQSGTVYRISEAATIAGIAAPQGVRILGVRPHELTIATGAVVTKRVPVVLRSNIQCRQGFECTDSLVPYPSSIEIRGSAEAVAAISMWPTERLALQDLYESTSVEVMLRDSLQSHITTIPQRVRVRINVEQTAEVTIEDVPIVPAEGVPSTTQFVPRFVRVTVRGGAEKLSSLVPSSISAVASPTSSLVRPTVMVPPTLRVVRVEPSIVRVQ